MSYHRLSESTNIHKSLLYTSLLKEKLFLSLYFYLLLKIILINARWIFTNKVAI